MSGAACRQRRNRSLITATTHGSAYGRLPPPSARLTRLLRHRSLPTPAKLSLTRTTRPCSYHLITCTITSTASFAYHFCHYYCCSSSSIWIYLDLFGSIWVYLGLTVRGRVPLVWDDCLNCHLAPLDWFLLPWSFQLGIG